MNLILTMAGKYTRFVNEGYKLPKYLLPWGRKSIISEIINNINNEFKNIYLIANKRDEIYMPHLHDILKDLDIPRKNLFLVPDTEGQSETAKVGIDCIIEDFSSLDGPICFHNIDTILYNRDLSYITRKLEDCDGLIDIFLSSNRNYSYVFLEDERVVSIVEKVVISNYATSGFYVFKNIDMFLNYYSDKTLYISDIYQKMIDDGLDIRATNLHHEKDTIVLGSPSEYLSSSYVLDL